LLMRIYRELYLQNLAEARERKNVLIYGAGFAGAGLVREIRFNPRLQRRVVGFIDDDPNKKGEVIHGVTVLGSGRDATMIVERFERRGRPIAEILIAMPTASGLQMREALATCRAANVACRTLPGTAEILANRALGDQIREISVEDLLGRAAVELDEKEIRHALCNNVVMVTGAGGSIGSELCRQIAKFNPRLLVLVDRAESDLFRINLELLSKHRSVGIVAELCDIAEDGRVQSLLQKHGVDHIFHAAAYKHVPMLESHPVEAVRNNICGTWNLAEAARNCGVKRFVMISSDKAVNPTNIMGVTKRVSELIISSFPPPLNGGPTSLVSVRFGNVLASNGSVVPIFQAQIAGGGPVTVTHPDVQRYFMTVREAVQLVLQASIMGRGGEIFALDMGQPVRIVDLARNMIRLAGRIPDEEIEIRFTGLRPGEKLNEELLSDREHLAATSHEKIKLFKGPPVDPQQIRVWMSDMKNFLQQRNETELIRHLAAVVPEYQPGATWRHVFEEAEMCMRAGSL